jgi:2-polyprenyl-3-methyl-5-hydroxy-6-metoxy-1,4-benzoquinol methylase
MTLAGFACHICGAQDLAEVPEFVRLPRVTSDCKPFPAGGQLAVCHQCGAVQKPANARWREEAASIYRNYDIYFQSGGVEQSVFDPTAGLPRLRSQVLLEHLNVLRPFAETGTALDVGCGKGTFLSAFARLHPGWKLSGYELSRANEPVLAEIPGFGRLYTGPLSDLPSDFDLITLVHALEHFETPVDGLRELAPKLAPDGMIVVEVPNVGATPFDLLVADHASHFTRADLDRLTRRAGLAVLALADDWMVKELSLAAIRAEAGTRPVPPSEPGAVYDAVVRRVAWLGAVLDQARNAAGGTGPFGIFGTSVAAMWLYGELESAVDFFVDEDPGRIGTLHGRPVLAPDRIPNGATVYLTLIPHVAQAVATRIGRSDVRLEVPPVFAD